MDVESIMMVCSSFVSLSYVKTYLCFLFAYLIEAGVRQVLWIIYFTLWNCKLDIFFLRDCIYETGNLYNIYQKQCLKIQ